MIPGDTGQKSERSLGKKLIWGMCALRAHTLKDNGENSGHWKEPL